MKRAIQILKIVGAVAVGVAGSQAVGDQAGDIAGLVAQGIAIALAFIARSPRESK